MTEEQHVKRTTEGDVHTDPGSHSALERAATVTNLLVRTCGLPDEWLLDVGAIADHDPFISSFLGVAEAQEAAAISLESFVLGLALGSGVVTEDKAREFLAGSNVYDHPELLARFGVAVRDARKGHGQ